MAKAKELVAVVKLQCPGGSASAAPPVGPALGQHGVNIGQFVREFNDKTRDAAGVTIPVVVEIYKDKSFKLTFKSPPAAVLLKQAAGLAKGSSQPLREKVANKVTRRQLEEIYEKKKNDLNATTKEAGMRTIAGTARSMGLEVED